MQNIKKVNISQTYKFHSEGEDQSAWILSTQLAHFITDSDAWGEKPAQEGWIANEKQCVSSSYTLTLNWFKNTRASEYLDCMALHKCR